MLSSAIQPEAFARQNRLLAIDRNDLHPVSQDQEIEDSQRISKPPPHQYHGRLNEGRRRHHTNRIVRHRGKVYRSIRLFEHDCNQSRGVDHHHSQTPFEP
jgi:hypothetical protein